VILLALVMATAPVASKHAIQVYGYPDTTCADWTRAGARDANRGAMEGWILGFVSGFNAFSPVTENIAPDTNSRGLIGWVDNYCAANPLDGLSTAGFRLVAELRHRAQR
jgi:hypothetical protein